MNVGLVRTIATLVLFFAALGIIIGYLLHSPKATGLGAISGNATVFRARKPIDAFLDRVVAWSAVFFALSSFILAILRQS